MIQLLLAIIYLAFISLGLPDALLGSAWPVMYQQFDVPVSYAGWISMIIAFGTIISSLMSDRLTKALGTGRVTAISVGVTAVALFGFSVSGSFGALCMWAIPYGLGAGCVDAALNNYVAVHYASRHMSWLHCMWGVGATVGPYIMGAALTGGQSWNMGYRYISFIQIGLTILLFATLRLWKQNATAGPAKDVSPSHKPLSLVQVFRIRGVRQILAAFFCYCAVEQTTGLWASSYLVLHWGVSDDLAASFAGLFYIGITAGRAVSGFLTFRLSDNQMIRLGEGIILAGILLMLIPFGEVAALAGLILIGLGCAPIYPSIIHSTPAHFGADRSQAIIGVEMAFAYIGTCVMPPLFGALANAIGIYLFPWYLIAILAVMFFAYESLTKIMRAPKHV